MFGHFAGMSQVVHDIRTITLDLDDTLWAIAPVIARAEQRLRDWYGVHYPRVPERFPQADTLDLRQQVIARHPERAHDLTFQRRELMRSMAAESGYHQFDVDAAFAVFEKARNEVSLYPDVRPVLQVLHDHYTLIAVTNGNASLDKIGIADLFDDYICARDVGAAKPARRIFAAAVEAGGASAAETLHVGDHPEIDIEGARAAGLATAWMNRAGMMWPAEFSAPTVTITDLHQLDQMLAAARQNGRMP
ncbi:MAG TPA: HAD family hydrolase [Woeseiaceae bacterium]|nr:HAD family hydrolase [Woeseiaceae bacterium]